MGVGTDPQRASTKTFQSRRVQNASERVLGRSPFLIYRFCSKRCLLLGDGLGAPSISNTPFQSRSGLNASERVLGQCFFASSLVPELHNSYSYHQNITQKGSGLNPDAFSVPLVGVSCLLRQPPQLLLLPTRNIEKLHKKDSGLNPEALSVPQVGVMSPWGRFLTPTPGTENDSQKQTLRGNQYTW